MNDEREIWVFGNSDKSELGFLTRTHFEKYISAGIFEDEQGRYRYTSSKNADVIVLSRDGSAFGHFEISEKVKPTEGDRKTFPPVQYVYIVRSSTLYETPILLSKLSIKLGQFGKRITENEFNELQQLAGKVTENFGGAKLPTSSVELAGLLRLVKQRLGQTEFRASLVEAYRGRCAITDCDVVEALEAAHIVPHCEVESNAPSNGLLLRADIHSLFDRLLIGIDPATKTVRIRKELSSTCYSELDGAIVVPPNSVASNPSKESLEARWKDFLAQEQ